MRLPLWLLPVLAAVVIAILYIMGVIPDRTVGAVIAFACVLLPAPYAGVRLGQVVTDAKAKGALAGICVLAAIVAAVSIYGALFPGEAHFSGQLSEAQNKVEIGQVPGGPYLLVVEGALPEQEGEVTVEYKLKLTSGESAIEKKGEIWRRFDQVRVGKRGTAMAEHHRTNDKHTIFLGQGQGTVELTSVSPPLPNGLHFRLHRILLPMNAFVIISAILFVLGAFVEGRFGNDRLRGLVATSLAFTIAVGYMFPDQMTDEAYVKPAIGVAVTSIFFSIFVGGAVAAMLRRVLRKPAA
ncbi:MAG: hypothetical protein IT381_29710 [Deltaproteobacteria bacterium]|nr:hypothetical protein [Deltaproteobacteria bacterium]